MVLFGVVAGLVIAFVLFFVITKNPTDANGLSRLTQFKNFFKSATANVGFDFK